jgi:tetratricopeptide (TPR) repeat protein
MVQQPPASQQASRPQAPPQEMMQEPLARRAMPQPVTPERESMPAGSSEAAVTAKPASSTRELWISAREEYHRGNIEGSISNYQQVIANSTDNYDAYGELGNVYLSRGKYREAADAYFEAASILVKQGKTGRARSLLPMLARLDRKKADELHQLINSSSS